MSCVCENMGHQSKKENGMLDYSGINKRKKLHVDGTEMGTHLSSSFSSLHKALLSKIRNVHKYEIIMKTK
jgi:hypothetical protein